MNVLSLLTTAVIFEEPKKFEDIFINNLHKNNKNGIVLSWAVKGQGGDGHFNEQNNDYIKSKICKLGYINDIESENQLRDDKYKNAFGKTSGCFVNKFYTDYEIPK